MLRLDLWPIGLPRSGGSSWPVCVLTPRPVHNGPADSSALDPEVLVHGRVERAQGPEADAQGAQAGAEAEALRAHATHHLAVSRVHLPAQTHHAG